MSESSLVEELLNILPWRCAICCWVATRQPVPRYTKTVRVWYFESGGIKLLFTGGSAADAEVKAKREVYKRKYGDWTFHYEPPEDAIPLFCDEHGLDGPYKVMRRSFELRDMGTAGLVRRAQRMVGKRPRVKEEWPTRFERILDA